MKSGKELTAAKSAAKTNKGKSNKKVPQVVAGNIARPAHAAPISYPGTRTKTAKRSKVSDTGLNE